jgi:dTDP-4-amino-4,6-dideoxygalactose transaminase
MNIPFSPPYIDQSVIDEVVSSLNSGWITSGPKVKALELAIAKYTEIQNVLCVNSWTSGAFMMLKWLGVRAGDEVIVPAYTYSATALVVLHCGAKPVMVDVTEDFVISVDTIRKAITPKTKAIIPVDIAGWPCDYGAIMRLVNEPEIVAGYIPKSKIQEQIGRIMVIADSAHSFGALKEHKPACNLADISIFSLHAVKNLTTAEGGAVCINLPSPFDNKEVFNYLKMMSLNGQTKDAYMKSEAGSWKYDIIMQGLKINLPDVCAAIGLAQIKKYDMLMKERKRIFYRYSDLLKIYGWVQLPPQDNETQSSSYHLYALRVKNISEMQRDLIIEEITKAGIAVNVHFIPLPMLSLFKESGYMISDFPVSYDNYSREISLPIYPQITNIQVEYIVSNIVKAYESVTLNTPNDSLL